MHLPSRFPFVLYIRPVGIRIKSYVSPALLSSLMFTFQRKPNQRPTTSELLEHPFIIDDAHSHSNSDHALSFSNPNGGGMDASSPGDGAAGGGECLQWGVA